MSKENEENAVEETTDKAVNTELAEKVAKGNVSDLLKKTERQGFSLTSSYLDMEEGETRKFVAMSLSTMTVQDQESEDKEATKDIPVVVMIDENDSTVSAGQTVIYNTLKNPVLPCPVEIVCKGEKKLQGGHKYIDYDVFPLNLSK